MNSQRRHRKKNKALRGKGPEKKSHTATTRASSTPDELSEAFRLTMGICFINHVGYER
jgi:hypothetical protein